MKKKKEMVFTCDVCQQVRGLTMMCKKCSGVNPDTLKKITNKMDLIFIVCKNCCKCND